MRRRVLSLGCFIFLCFGSLGNHGCPQNFEPGPGQPAGAGEPGDFHIHLEATYDGTLIWTAQTPAVVQGPNQILIELPFPLTSFQKEIVGTHNVNEDLQAGFERRFDVRRFNSSTAYVDFFNNGVFDAGIDYEINLPAGVGSLGQPLVVLSDPEPDPLYSRGVHGGLVLDGTRAEFGSDQYAFDVPVYLLFNNSAVEVRKNLMLLVGASILPHVPFGVFPELSPAGGSVNQVITEIVLTNSWNVDSEAEVEFFNAVTGEEQEVTIEGFTSREHVRTVGANSSVVIEVTSDDPLLTTWGLVYGDPSVEASTVFRTAQAGGQLQGAAGSFVAEAGIAGSGVSTLHVLDVVQRGEGISTAFAVVNPTSAFARMTLTLKDSNGFVVGEQELVLQPKTQTARFATDLLPQAQGLLAGFEGSLVISSDTDVAVISLRTLNGLQTSSLTSGSF